jgi:hypothetical protein
MPTIALYKVALIVKTLILREIVKGFEIKTKKQQLCKKGDFLVAEIDAKVGGFGIVPEELEGAIVNLQLFFFLNYSYRYKMINIIFHTHRAGDKIHKLFFILKLKLILYAL